MELRRVANNTYEFTIHNGITKDELHLLSETFQEFHERNEKVNLLGVFQSFPSMDSLLSLSEAIKAKFRSFGIINKYAILGDKHQLKNLVAVANFFTPAFPVKAFDTHERASAISWLQEEEEVKAYKAEDFLTGVDIEKMANNCYSIKLDNSKVDHASMSALNSILDNLDKGEKINLLIQFNKFPSVENFKTIIEGLKVDFKIFGRLDRYAIVSDAKFIETYSKVGNFMTPGIKVKAFANAEMEEAKTWLLTK